MMFAHVHRNSDADVPAESGAVGHSSRQVRELDLGSFRIEILKDDDVIWGRVKGDDLSGKGTTEAEVVGLVCMFQGHLFGLDVRRMSSAAHQSEYGAELPGCHVYSGSQRKPGEKNHQWVAGIVDTRAQRWSATSEAVAIGELILQEHAQVRRQLQGFQSIHTPASEIEHLLLRIEIFQERMSAHRARGVLGLSAPHGRDEALVSDEFQSSLRQFSGMLTRFRSAIPELPEADQRQQCTVLAERIEAYVSALQYTREWGAVRLLLQECAQFCTESKDSERVLERFSRASNGVSYQARYFVRERSIEEIAPIRESLALIDATLSAFIERIKLKDYVNLPDAISEFLANFELPYAQLDSVKTDIQTALSKLKPTYWKSEAR